jgi:hypothetical protein
MQRGWCRVEFVQLTHQYLQLTPLIGGSSDHVRRPSRRSKSDQDSPTADPVEFN